MDSDLVRQWLRNAASSIRANRDYLTQLDAAIGDADHGVNMSRGFSEVADTVGAFDRDATPGRLLVLAGQTLFSAVGGASGALWGFALQRAGRALGETPELDRHSLPVIVSEALAGVIELGAALEGDKTMVDALAPAARALEEQIASGATIFAAVKAAHERAEAGVRATVPLLARRGRAFYLRERSIGHQDPGATSTALIVAALEPVFLNVA